MNTLTRLSPEVLEIDAPKVAEHIESSIRDCLHHQLKRKGVVLGLSGGIDSSVAAALCVRALGADRRLHARTGNRFPAPRFTSRSRGGRGAAHARR